MKRLVWFISALILCVCIMAVWRTRKESANFSSRPQAVNSSSLTTSDSSTTTPLTFASESRELNDICTPHDSLSYRGFIVRRSFDSRRAKSIVTIARGRKALVHEENDLDARDLGSSCFGLYPVLGTQRKQLLVVQTTGGAHCCFQYRIYDFSLRGLRLIFDGTKYPTIGDGFDELTFQDIDGDGVMEFTQRVMTFDYCCDVSYAGSPQPSIVFKYSPQQRVFLPDVRRFSKFLLRKAHDQRAKAREDPLLNWGYLFTAFTQYIYAGRERTAWRIYNSREGQYLPRRREIRKLLQHDPIYRFIYGRRGT